jgi:hypothetical protein
MFGELSGSDLSYIRAHARLSGDLRTVVRLRIWADIQDKKWKLLKNV